MTKAHDQNLTVDVRYLTLVPTEIPSAMRADSPGSKKNMLVILVDSRNPSFPPRLIQGSEGLMRASGSTHTFSPENLRRFMWENSTVLLLVTSESSEASDLLPNSWPASRSPITSLQARLEWSTISILYERNGGVRRWFHGKQFGVYKPGSDSNKVNLGEPCGQMRLVRRNLGWSRTGRNRVMKILANVTQKVYK